MTKDKVETAMREARRFLARAEEHLAAMAERSSSEWSCPLTSGALRRASLDLTRGLAVLRRPPH